MRVLKGIVAFIMILLFSCGFSIFAYPYIHNYVVEKDMQEQVQDFWDQLGTDPTEQDTLPTEAPTAPTEPTLPPREHEALWEDMLEYNRRIWEEKQAGLCDPWSYQQPSFTLGEYGLEDEVFGVISIPALDLEMPLYLGATSAHMEESKAQAVIPLRASLPDKCFSYLQGTGEIIVIIQGESCRAKVHRTTSRPAGCHSLAQRYL